MTDEKDIEQFVLTSAGIDIGTTTSHLIFSKLTLEKVFKNNRIKFEVTKREIIYKSDIILTPLIDGKEIDYLKVAEFLKKEYKKAGLSAEDIDTGAVIITGETAKKQNAEELVKALAHKAGKFVCAAAGPNFESVISAMGSGAVAYSKKTGKTIMNIDIGGGTSNIAVIKNGDIVDVSCVNVGGRLLAFSPDNEIIRIEEPIKSLEKEVKTKFELGQKIDDETKENIARLLAKSLLEVILRKDSVSELTEKLLVTRPLVFKEAIDEISFSGGVGEYIYNRTKKDYNDLGLLLANEIKKLVKENNLVLHEPEELIRATVIGAGQYTLQVSGVTTHISNVNLLPLRNIPVIVPKIKAQELTEENIVNAIRRSLEIMDVKEGQDLFALAFRGPIGGSYSSLKTFANSIVKAIPNTVKKENPIIMIFEQDIGNSVGNVMKRETKAKEIISIDEIMVEEGDFIDIDKPKAQGQAVPVIIKSLVFAN